MIYGWWYCIYIGENIFAQNRMDIWFISACAPKVKQSLCRWCASSLEAAPSFRGRIWKICGICQHLTILSHQYIFCLNEKCVLNCRHSLFFFLAYLFNLTLRGKYGAPTETSRDMTPECCVQAFVDGAEDSSRMAQRTLENIILDNEPRMSVESPTEKRLACLWRGWKQRLYKCLKADSKGISLLAKPQKS